MPSPRFHFIPLALLLSLLLVAGFPAAGAGAQVPPEQADLIDRPIVRVDIRGLDRVSETRVRNVLGTQPGNPYNPAEIERDMETLVRLGEFRSVTPLARLEPDGSVVVIFQVVEQPLLRDVQTVGNRLVSDQELLAVIPLRAGVPRDEWLIEIAQRRIRQIYRDRGHYRAEVLIDESELEETGILLFRIIEGPRVRIRAIEFDGNESFSDRLLRSQIKSREAVFLFSPGRLDTNQIASDLAAIDAFYKDRGYLDVRVDREIQLSPDDREAKIVFIIREGRVYTMRSVTVVGASVMTDEQIAARLDIKTGDVYSQDRIRRSIQVIDDDYGRMGYVDVSVRALEIRTSDDPVVDLRLEIDEPPRHRLGLITTGGNPITRDKVIRRELRGLEPGRPIDAVQLEEARRRLVRTRLFNDVKLTLQEPEPDEPEYRDLLVEVKERDTGSLNFGVGVGSDQGVFGEITLTQRNFDITEFPESFDELIRGQAFRGAGQSFTLRLAPGNEISEYSIAVTEPYLLDRPITLHTRASFRQRQFNVYDEERLSGALGLSRRIGEFWTVGASTRFDRVKLPSIAPFAPTAVFDAAGPDFITGISARVTRNTTGTFIRPGRGSVLELGIEQVLGDYNFTTVSGEYTVFITIAEDFLGRRSILRLNTRAAYIIDGDDAPIYERFYLGGRTLRGLAFRTVSPKGVRADTGGPSREPVGGTWMFFAGAQYEHPIFAEMLNGVVFVDTGTVENGVGFDDYRVTAGFGIRLYLDAFGPVPLAFDFGFPFIKGPGDRDQLFSFSIELPF